MIKPFHKIWLRLIRPSDMMLRCQTIHRSIWLMADHHHRRQQQQHHHHKQVKKLVKHRLHRRKTITNSTNRTISTQQITSIQRHPTCTNTHKMSNLTKQYISVILNRSVVYPPHCFILINKMTIKIYDFHEKKTHLHIVVAFYVVKASLALFFSFFESRTKILAK